ncbi:MAG: DNA-binding domain-containing protein [Aeromonadaceae bacterium]|nr:DNA-binding domain-containing protein [Aeromonadaceae bacterium]
MSEQARWCAALLTPGSAPPSGLTTWNGSDPARRFDVYRNNVLASLTLALADTYPVVRALVGEAFFAAMAVEFIRHAPPRSPVLVWYGADFPAFLAGFAPVAGLPYLVDVARLEWLRVEAWHAADAQGLSEPALIGLLSDETGLARRRFVLHPALRILHSAYPVVSVWLAHQGAEPAKALGQIDLGEGQSVMLSRPGLEVELIPLTMTAASFIQRLGDGEPLAEAVRAAGPFDLPHTLSLLIRNQALIATLPLEETCSKN